MLLNDDRSWLTVSNFNYKWCAYPIIFMKPICTPHVYNCRKIKTNTTVNAQSRILLRDFTFYLLRNNNFWNNNVAFSFYVDFFISSIIEKDYYRYWLSNTAGFLYETGTEYPSRSHGFTPAVCWGPCCSSF